MSIRAGMEVPIIGTDSIKFIDVSVPDFGDADLSTTTSATAASITIKTSLTEDYASSSIIGDPPLSFIWRIHKSQPKTLELLQLSANKDFPVTTWLRITFPHALCPFAYVCQNQSQMPAFSTTNPYLLYALTISGVVYLIKLRNISAYSSLPVLARDEVIQFSLNDRYSSNSEPAAITSVAATAGCLAVGRIDGSVAHFQLGLLHHSTPGFVNELRDDSGIGRLWGFMSRGRVVGAVQDLVISEAHGLKLLFVLHSDGMLRVWNLSLHNKILSHALGIPNSEGVTFARLWVGEFNEDASITPLAVLCRHDLEIRREMIHVYHLHCTLGDKTVLSVESSMQDIPLEEGECIDVKLTSDKIWILKDNGLLSHKLFHIDMEDACCYTLQEEFVAEQLFQSSKLSSDDLLWTTYSIYSSMKENIVPFVSSIFIRRLLLPGVHHNGVLRSTLLDYQRHWTDMEFQSLTVDGLKKEVCSVIENQGVSESPMSIFCHWKNFCAHYYHYWCKNNSPCGLLVQSAGAVCLVRKNSVSLFRDLENIEMIIDGSSDELVDLASFGLDLSNDESEHGILLEVLRCIINMSQHLGKPASAVFYESLISTPIVSSEEIVPRFLKILETGYSSSVSSDHITDLGGSFAWEKELADRKSLRKFSIDMLLSLHTLSKKATSWSKVLNVIESYLQFLVPRRIIQKLNAEMSFDINNSILIQATSQIAKVIFESALDVLLFVSYLLKISGQINMLHDDTSRIQLEFIPMIQEIVSEWLIIHFLSTTPSESPSIEDFSSQLSSLQIDNKTDRRSWNEKLGKCGFTLAFILSQTFQSSSGDPSQPSSQCLPNPQEIVNLVRGFTSWIIWGKTGEESTSFLRRSSEIALILLRHGQYGAVEYLLTIVEANSRREKVSRSIQDNDGDWCILHHLLGCCLLAQARYGFQGVLKEKKVCEAIRCFFRASSGQGASKALQDLSQDAGLPNFGFDDCASSAAWKLHYYQWAMQIFEQYNISEGACQFALAALEQVDEALSQKDDSSGTDVINESDTTIKGRLWANVFKFTLDLNHLYDAYCAILSNPDEENKYICLRRFIIVLYERGSMKVLCNGQLPFNGLAEKIEQELAWKAERSEILAKPNPYKLLYAFEMHRHNWRRAASYIYQYSARLRTEVDLRDHQHMSLVLQERLNGLSAAINALHLVQSEYAWINPLFGGNTAYNDNFPSKKAKKLVKEHSTRSDVQAQRLQFYIDVEKLEKEFILTSAEYLLSLANVKWTFTGTEKAPSDLVDLLVETNLYEMAFTVLLKFWNGSGLNRELERVFSAMSLKCCPNKPGSSSTRMHGLLLTSSKEEIVVHGSTDMGPTSQNYQGNAQWETLELYLEKYRTFQSGLPATVAETLLRTDPQIELPLWLVHMFKESRRDRTWGMAGQVSNPASLFQLYVDYGRFTEATNLLLEYTESFASVRPSDLINRKKPFAAWFPYTTIERLWCQLEELSNLGHMVDHYRKLKSLLHGALQNHLKQVKVDSEDALSAAAC
ncbi:nuclear pore complex protein [Salix suchowensis]|nr:nuclear pore complex protein [Salix suchowensis]